MPVTSELAQTPLYIGTGLVDTYAYGFLIYAATDLVVVERDLNDTETILVLNTDYTITGVGVQTGGNIILTSSLPNGHKLRGYRSLPLDQQIKLKSQGAYFLGNLEQGLDRSRMIDQQISAVLDRCLKKSVTSDEVLYDVDMIIAEVNQSRDAAIASQSAAETAETNAVNAADSASNSATMAQNAQTAAEAAQTAAENAQIAAESAQTIAQSAQTAAEAAQTAAENAQIAAESAQAEFENFLLSLSTVGWQLASAQFYRSFSVLSQTNQPFGLDFNSDGTKMYTGDYFTNVLFEYNLASPWIISTASYSQSFSLTAQVNALANFRFKPDGTRLYVTATNNNRVCEYSLSTPWDISSLTYVQYFSFSGTMTVVNGLEFKPDGTKMFVTNDPYNKVYEYSLSTAWDVSTAAFVKDLDISTWVAGPYALAFNPDGTIMYVLNNTGAWVEEFTLNVPWDIATATFFQEFQVYSQTSSVSGIKFKPDGFRMYITSYGNDRIVEYITGYYVKN